MDDPTLALIWVVSAVSRDTISPVLAWSKKSADSEVRCANNALAERGDEVVTRGAGEGEQCSDPDHDQEIAVDQAQAALGKAEIDHPPGRNRHHQRSHGGKDQGAKG
jgi:hypothetical protein